MLDRPLPTAGDAGSPLEARIFLVGQQLGPMAGELLLSQAPTQSRGKPLALPPGALPIRSVKCAAGFVS
jgi:hypothetical protein